MGRLGLITVLVAGVLAGGTDARAAAPPFTGTAFIAPELFTASDPSALKRVGYVGRRNRSVFDRRPNAFVTRRVFEFKATLSGQKAVLVRVNPEFGSRNRASTQAKRYARVVGQLPLVLRGGLRTITINAGNEDFGGGGRDIVIHVGRTAEYTRDGALEEILVHEITHAVLDDDHAATAGWRAAQEADPAFISTYARDNPTREDVAESFVPYLAVRYRRDRVDPAVVEQIEAAIPARLDYFDKQEFDVRPLGR